MMNQKDREIVQLSEKEKEFSKTTHHWLAQYDEEDDFMFSKASNSPPETSVEE